MDEPRFGPALRRALAPLLSPRLFYGAAICCVAGLALGAWLKPPPARTFSGADWNPVVHLPQDQTADADVQGGAAPEWPQYAEAAPAPTTVASVSPPADDQRSAVRADDAAADLDDDPDTDASLPQPQSQPQAQAQPQPQPQARQRPGWAYGPPAGGRNGGFQVAQQPYGQGGAWGDGPPPDPRGAWQGPPRDWAAYDARARGDGDEDEGPPPPRWSRPPPDRRWAPPPGPRRWDPRPDGPAYPVNGDEDDGDDGG